MSAKYVVAPKPARAHKNVTAPKNVIARGAKQSKGIPHSPKKIEPVLKDGLPMHAFSIFADVDDTSTWQLPHHSKTLGSPAKDEQTVDWTLVEKAVALISRYGLDGQRVIADPELIILAAKHLAGHYRANGRPVPTALCVFDIGE